MFANSIVAVLATVRDDYREQAITLVTGLRVKWRCYAVLSDGWGLTSRAEDSGLEAPSRQTTHLHCLSLPFHGERTFRVAEPSRIWTASLV